jgi:hypothetical protein
MVKVEITPEYDHQTHMMMLLHSNYSLLFLVRLLLSLLLLNVHLKL